MARLKLNVYGFNENISQMTINGKGVKVSSISNGVRTYEIESPYKTAHIVIYKNHYYSLKWWAFTSILYFIISLFGIFDIRQDKKCTVIDCRYDIDLNEDTVANMKVFTFTDGGKVVEIESNTKCTEIANIQYFDKRGQKRRKIMNLVKCGILALSLILTIIAFLI